MNHFIVRFMKYIGIPTIFLLFWILGSVVFNSKIPFSTLLFRYPEVSVRGIHQNGLLAGESYVGEFTARENHLGIITLQFEAFDRTDFRKEDILNFRIREKGEKNWYFESTYRSGLIHDSLHFPFGFSPIKDSKNKLYQFELVSSKGNSTHAVKLDSHGSALSSYHVIPRNEITSGNTKLLSFLGRKIINSYTDLDFIFSSLIFSLPLFLYVLFFMFRLQIKTVLTSTIFIRIFLVFVMSDIFFLSSFYLGIFIEMAILWILIIFYAKAEGLVSFLTGFLIMGVWVFWLLFGISQFTYKLNLWVYTFFTIGTVQFIFEGKNINKNRISYIDFLQKIYKA